MNTYMYGDVETHHSVKSQQKFLFASKLAHSSIRSIRSQFLMSNAESETNTIQWLLHQVSYLASDALLQTRFY